MNKVKLGFLVGVFGLAGCAKGGVEASRDELPAKKKKEATLSSICAPGLQVAPDKVVATVNNTAILCSEIYSRDKQIVDVLEKTYKSKLREVHALALDNLISDRLLQVEADKVKLSIEKFVASKVQIRPVSEEDIQEFYDQAMASGEKLPPLKEIKAKVKSFVVEQRQKSALIAYRKSLRENAVIEKTLP